MGGDPARCFISPLGERHRAYDVLTAEGVEGLTSASGETPGPAVSLVSAWCSGQKIQS